MITGDTPLTACFAAGRLHIVDRPVLIASHKWVAEPHSTSAELCQSRQDDFEPEGHGLRKSTCTLRNVTYFLSAKCGWTAACVRRCRLVLP